MQPRRQVFRAFNFLSFLVFLPPWDSFYVKANISESLVIVDHLLALGQQRGRCLLAKLWQPIKLRWENVNLSPRWLFLLWTDCQTFFVKLVFSRKMAHLLFVCSAQKKNGNLFCMLIYRSGYFGDPSLGVWQLPRINEYSWILRFLPSNKIPLLFPFILSLS